MDSEHLRAGFNYESVWFGKANFALYYWNSFKVTGLTTLLSVLVSSMAAYGFTKIQFRGRNALFVLVLATYMIPAEATLVPLFIMFRTVGLYDTHIGLILLGGFSVLGTFLLRQFFASLSNEYMESAQIDGAAISAFLLPFCFRWSVRLLPPMPFCVLSGPGTTFRHRWYFSTASRSLPCSSA
jgi:multiple sugar transport system permease protein